MLAFVAGLALMNLNSADQIVITQSGTVKLPSDMVLPGGDTPGSAAVVIRGDGLVVDFAGASLYGSPITAEPDARKGFGLVIEGNDITVKNLRVHGYKIGVFASGARNLELHNIDASYNYKPKLKSGRLKEDVADWMSYHKNEEREWFRFGAALYLEDCEAFQVRDCSATGGQNGLMLVRSNGGTAWNNNFSFLSALGVAMYRSSDNKIMHNSIDYCVRGYSHRFYNRGQDSAGILMYEQCHRNTIAYNSVTHGGDGLFLWAGQHTMDTGQGGCNDNVFYGNDFSHAPTNGIEATFSRNVFANNLMLECWHGVWGGYSYDSVWAGNTFGLNGEAFAIEHGQNNRILGNIFRMDTLGVYLFTRPGGDADWGYPKYRDTASHGYVIADNVFFGIPGTVFSFTDTKNVSLTGNFIKNYNLMFSDKTLPGIATMQGGQVWTTDAGRAAADNWPVTQEGVEFTTGSQFAAPPTYMAGSGLVVRRPNEREMMLATLRQSEFAPWNLRDAAGKSPAQMSPEELRDLHAKPYFVEPMQDGLMPFLGAEGRRGRSTILIDEWGPYDYRYPKIWLEDSYDNPSGGKSYVFRIYGPDPGKWEFVSSDGARYVKMKPEWLENIPSTPPYVDPEIAKLSGDMGDRILVHATGQFNFTLRYTGARTVDYRGIEQPAGTPIEFSYKHDEVGLTWNVQFWNYNGPDVDPRTNPAEFRKIYETPPNGSLRVGSLEGTWSGSPAQGVNKDYFATLAESRFTVEPGDYELSVTSDDGVRVLLDGKEIFVDWTYHGPQTQSIPLRLTGKHTLRIEHFELSGYAALQARLVKK